MNKTRRYFYLPEEGILSKLRLILVFMAFMGVASTAMPEQAAIKWESVGQVSSYGRERQGKRTSSGEIFNYHKLTAAHRTLPFGSIVLVTNLHNGKQVRVRINDRGPGFPSRIIDVSTAAAKRLGFNGLTDASIEVIYYGPITPDYSYLALRCGRGQGSKKPCSSHFTRKPSQQVIGEEIAWEKGSAGIVL